MLAGRNDVSTLNAANDVIQHATVLEPVEDESERVTKRRTEEQSMNKSKARTPDKDDFASWVLCEQTETGKIRSGNGKKGTPTTL